MPWTTSPKVMEFRRRSGGVDVAVGTLDGWRRHLSSRNASLLSFFSFLSIMPLLLAATTILGWVLEGNDDLRERLLDGAVADIPVIGDTLATPGALTGNIWALLIGLLGALWSSTRAFVGLHSALDDIWEVDVDERAATPKQRARALLGILVIGTGQVASMAIAGVVSAAGLPGFSNVLLTAATVAVNVAVVAAMYRFLNSHGPAWRDVVPGAVMAGVVITVLQQFGAQIVQRIARSAGDTYGTFAIVLGLISWLGFIAIGVLMAAELNAYLVRRRTHRVTGASAEEAAASVAEPGDDD